MRWILPLLCLLACHGPDDTDAGPRLDVVAEGLPSALVSIQGTAADDVWAVGSDVGDGPLVLHWDGAAWETVATGTTGDLWWVWPTPERVTMVGAGGTILELDRATGLVTDLSPEAPEITFFGVWGGDGFAYAVGGDVAGDLGPAAYERTSEGWIVHEGLTAGLSAPDLLYKVHGSGPSDVWAVGSRGIVRHGVDGTFGDVDAGVQSPLFTVHTGGPAPVAVGGFGQAVALHWDGTGWVDRSPDFQPQLNGVSGRGEDLVAVGTQGSVQRWDGEAWIADAERVTPYDLHGVWIDDDGGIWAVGGALLNSPMTEGVLAYQGAAALGSPELARGGS